MVKRESTFVNMVVTLLVVTLVAGGALGYVYDLTKDAIKIAKQKAQSEAITKVLPPFDKLGESYKVAAEDGTDSLAFFPAYKGTTLVGTAIKTYSKKGFGGLVTIMAGIDQSGNFSGYEVLEFAETPGLGTKMAQWFKNTDKPNQCIIGKNPKTSKFKVSKDGGDIDAITASTISSRAFLDAMVRAYNSYEKKLQPTAGTTGTK
ncbi:MAG: RnfABCDGE type electron transport complex subunit G [Prolixibacteraceae bacterium]|nr:RnfABCDGE type electron transport complex subunit G [Prolixibacteraceae bacterium]